MVKTEAKANPLWSIIRAKARGVNRRQFLNAVGIGGALTLLPRVESGAEAAWLPGLPPIFEGSTEPVNGAFTLPPLPYAYDALEPNIDAETMMLHHMRHHNAYVTALNNALAPYLDLKTPSLATLLTNLGSVPDPIRTTVRNNGGGHMNHSIFWATMAPNAGGAPVGDLAAAINGKFGSFDSFKAQFNATGRRSSAAAGSGWS